MCYKKFDQLATLPHIQIPKTRSTNAVSLPR